MCAVVIRCALHRIAGGIVGEIAVAAGARNARKAIAGRWILIGIAAAIARFTQAIAHSIVTITQIAVATVCRNQTVQRIVAEALVVGVIEAVHNAGDVVHRVVTIGAVERYFLVSHPFINLPKKFLPFCCAWAGLD